MEFPFNRGPHSNATHTHHHHQRNDDEEEYPPPGNAFSSFENPHQPPPPQPHYPPPGSAFSSFNNPHQPPAPQPHQPFYAESYPPPQPPQPETQVFHSSHVSSGHVSQDFNYSAPPPPPPSHHHHQPDRSLNLNYGYPPTPTPPPPVSDYSTPVPNATVHHVSHETHHPHFPTSSSVHHVSHQVPNLTAPAPPPLFTNRPTFRVVTKAAPNYTLTIRRGEVVLAPSDPSDQYQHWYKDEKYSTRVKDTEGCPAFSLVNKVTGEAIKHSIGGTHPVRLIRYNPDYLDQSILWSESRDLGGGYRAIRMVNNVHLNMDAFHGDKHSGGVHDGTTIVLWEWNKGDNQQWKILPY